MGDRELNSRRIIRSLVSVADIASRLETAQREQFQSIVALTKGTDVTKWNQRLGSEDEALERGEKSADLESEGKPPHSNRRHRSGDPYRIYYAALRVTPRSGLATLRVSRKGKGSRRGGEARKGEAKDSADLDRAKQRLAGVGKVIEDGLIKRIDVLIQRVS